LKLVIDTNSLFSYFWTTSIIRKIINSKKLDLITPKYAISELNKYKEIIIKKTKSNIEEYNLNIKKLENKITIIKEKEYISYFKKIKKIIDPKDIDFFAISIKEGIPLWSNDKLLKNQNQVKVFNTKEILFIIELLNLEY
jgi:predicted nucleic acid-binding protein